jgi:UDP-N-acetylmuramoyl-tripeptide--D-alanyl-D-alanine ligase
MGEHNLLNALCALSLASELGVPLSLAAEGLESVKPLFGRGEIISGEITLVVDCYNANADSMARSIATVRDLQWQGRKILVLGSMLELGENSAEAHGAVGRLAAESGADAVFLFGEEMEFGKRGLDGAGFEGFSLFTSDYEVLSRSVGNFVRPGDLVLLKGSRGMELERLLPVFERDGRVGTC